LGNPFNDPESMDLKNCISKIIPLRLNGTMRGKFQLPPPKKNKKPKKKKRERETNKQGNFYSKETCESNLNMPTFRIIFTGNP
jgi:hypothetical protein